jgi:hypothetical protein
MGGKALNKYGVFTERKNTEEFHRIGVQLQYKIQMTLDLKSEVVTCYYTKADHGDLDLLISVPTGRGIDWNNYIHEKFKPQAIYSNGGVYSFDYQNFQIDFIPISQSKWEIAKVYYSYDPLGNCMGKTFHKFGLSYGWDGLFYKFRNFNGVNSKNILITTDARKIFEFGGYDYDRYLKGFDTLEDIFKFVIDGKYFDSEMFQMENLKSIDKKRNRKRGSYHLFLNYLKDNNIDIKHNFYEYKELYIPDIGQFFPEAELLLKLDQLKKEDDLNKAVTEKFNGNIIMQWLPNLKGKELGQMIDKFKDCLGVSYNNFILNSSIEDIKYYFMKIYNKK